MVGDWTIAILDDLNFIADVILQMQSLYIVNAYEHTIIYIFANIFMSPRKKMNYVRDVWQVHNCLNMLIRTKFSVA